MSKNKLYTYSYFIKRLVESGFDVTRIPIHYTEEDPRYWSIFVNKKDGTYKNNIMITCWKTDNKYSFHFQGFQKNGFFLETQSMTIIITILLRAYQTSVLSSEEDKEILKKD